MLGILIAHCATKLTNCSFLSGQIETILPLLLLCFTECEMGHPNQIPLEHCPAFGSYTQTGTLLQNKGFTVGVPMKAGCCKTFKTDRFSKPVRPLTLSGNSPPFYWLALTCPSPPRLACTRLQGNSQTRYRERGEGTPVRTLTMAT